MLTHISIRQVGALYTEKVPFALLICRFSKVCEKMWMVDLQLGNPYGEVY